MEAEICLVPQNQEKFSTDTPYHRVGTYGPGVVWIGLPRAGDILVVKMEEYRVVFCALDLGFSTAVQRARIYVERL